MRFTNARRFAPLLMAACRFLLYFVAAAATLNRVSDAVLWHGLALAAYVTGLSYLARGESGPGRVRRWPLLLLIAPLVANGLVDSHRSAVAWAASVCLVGWLLWCLRGIWKQPVQNVGRSVAGLLAGIALVDGAAIAPTDGRTGPGLRRTVRSGANSSTQDSGDVNVA